MFCVVNVPMFYYQQPSSNKREGLFPLTKGDFVVSKQSVKASSVMYFQYVFMC